MWTLPRYKAGDRVAVRSKEEILATLDAQGCIDGMPFMPEMLKFCGSEFTVWAVAHKTCDTVNKTGNRRLDRTVHLKDTLCDGSAHGGCEAECNLYWNDAWLRPTDAVADALKPSGSGGVSESQLMQATRVSAADEAAPRRYRCQATQLPQATRRLPWWCFWQYWIDIRSRNYPVGFVLRTLGMAASRQLLRLPFGYRVAHRIADRVHRLLSGRPMPEAQGTIALGHGTPTAKLDLVPGEWVRIKPAAEIVATLNRQNKNRGMWFDPGQVPNCGRTFQVHRRVTQLIDERSGELVKMQNPCITLEGTLCNPEYADRRLLCPRNIAAYWREAWLERVDPPVPPA